VGGIHDQLDGVQALDVGSDPLVHSIPPVLAMGWPRALSQAAWLCVFKWRLELVFQLSCCPLAADHWSGSRDARLSPVWVQSTR